MQIRFSLLPRILHGFPSQRKSLGWLIRTFTCSRPHWPHLLATPGHCSRLAKHTLLGAFAFALPLPRVPFCWIYYVLMSSPPRGEAHTSTFREASLSSPLTSFRLPFLCFSPQHFCHMADFHLVFPHYSITSMRTESLACLLAHPQWAGVTTYKTILSSRTAQNTPAVVCQPLSSCLKVSSNQY